MATSNTTCKKLLKFYHFVHLEPLILMYAMSFGIVWPIFQPFIYYKQCISIWGETVVTQSHLPLAILEDFCDRVDDKDVRAEDLKPVLSMKHGLNGSMTVKEVQNELSRVTARFFIWLKLSWNIPTIITAPVIGTMSDIKGRKPVFLYILLVMVLGYYAILFCAEKLLETSVWLVLGAVNFNCLAGTDMAGQALLYSCMSDISNANTGARNTRVSMGTAVFKFGQVFGSMITTAILASHRNSFGTCFLALMTGLTCCALYTAFVLIETLHKTEKKRTTHKSYLNKVWDIFVDGFKIVLKNRRNGKRVKLCVALTCVCLYIFFAADVDSLIYLFLHNQMSWPNDRYTRFYSIMVAVNAFTLIFVPFLIERYSRISDLSIINVGLLVTLVKCIMFGLAKSDWLIYCSVLPQVLTSLTLPYFYAYMSKQVEDTEHGKLFQLVFVLSNLGRAFDAVSFNNVYTLFQDRYDNPGLTFVIEGLLLLIPSGMLIWLQFVWTKKIQNAAGKEMR